jgi:hypothetical protein
MKPVTQPVDGVEGAIPYCWSWPLDFLETARDATLDAFMAVGPLDSKITSDAIAATARALLFLSGIGSAGAWLRHYLNRDEREENASHRNSILAMVSRVRTVESNQELLAMQREVDTIIGETIECYDDGAIEEEELAAFGLVIGLFDHAMVERRAALQAGTLEPIRGGPVGHSLPSRR